MRTQQVLSELIVQGCERSVITYSSLISACEKAGDWKLALEFFEECTKDNCRPNVITFNSLISACSQGAHTRLESLPSFIVRASSEQHLDVMSNEGTLKPGQLKCRVQNDMGHALSMHNYQARSLYTVWRQLLWQFLLPLHGRPRPLCNSCAVTCRWAVGEGKGPV